ncbi:MAG: hypothetical protein ACRCVJ_18765 [Clostridium sp.]
MSCIYRKKLDKEDKYVCSAFLNWWEEDTPKDILYNTDFDCMCELFKEVK